jgi:hypothetical protein
MRSSVLFLGGMVWLASWGMSFGAEGPQPAGSPPGLVPIPSHPAETRSAQRAPSAEVPCEDPGWVCPQRRIRPYGKLLDKWASYGQFNCECSGSYKYPVPPQYTYHWPGMYSQPTMTQYMSPYRFPPLKLPPKGEDILQGPEEQPKENVSERITTRPIRPVSIHWPISR